MEQALAFFTGVIGTLLVLGIVKLILSGNRLRHLEDKVESLEDELENIHDWVDGIEEETQRLTEALDVRIDGEIDRVDHMHDELEKWATREFNTCEQNVDSASNHLDKLIDGLKSKCETLYKKKKG
jgi:predicted nuclease with TOPRIM domain